MKLSSSPIILLLCLASSASAQGLFVDGFLNESVGGSTLALNPAGDLVVSNIGSSGLDGVRVDISGSSGMTTQVEIDLQAGDACLVSGQHTLSGGTSAISELSILRTANGGATLQPDFSALGLSTYGLRLIRDGQIVHDSPGEVGPIEIDQFLAPWHWLDLYLREAVELDSPEETLFWCLRFGPGVACMVADSGTLYEVDLIEVYTDPLPLEDVSRLEFTASGPSEFTVRSEEMRFFEHWMHGRNDTQLDTQGATLVLIGQGATELTWRGQPDYGSLQVQALVAADHPGSTLGMRATSASGTTDAIVGGGDDDHDLGWMFTPDFSQLSSATYTLELYDQGQLVYSESARSGAAASMPAFRGFTRKHIVHLDGTSQKEWSLAGEPGGSAGVHGGIIYAADRMIIRSEPEAAWDTTVDDWVFETTGLSSDPVVTDISGVEPNTCLGTSYCVGATNSSGNGASMCSSGSVSIASDDLVLECSGLPQSVMGIFYYGPNQIQVPFGDGFRCVGGSVKRLSPQHSGGTGTFTRAFSNPGTLSPGQTMNFQTWYRDPEGGPAGFNLSNGHTLVFQP